MAKQSVIKCPKCGYLPNMLGDTCLKCNTRLEKVCGECGFANQVEKNYCDQCGAVLTLQPPPRNENMPPPPREAPKTEPYRVEMESIQDTVIDRATSFRRTAVAPPPPPGKAVPPTPAAPLPAKTKEPGSHLSSANVLIPDSTRLPRETPLPPGLLKKLLGPVVTIILIAVLGGILYMIAAPSLPRLRLLMTAKSYLANISQHKFEAAYELLSSNSKAACTMEEYAKNSNEYYSKVPAWQFKEVEVFAIDKSAAMIRYQLKEGDLPWKSDYISFVRENNRWARPYIWILFQPLEEALKRQDFPHALFLAQKLFLTDPVDPRSSGYLCVSEFFMGLHEKSVESCKRTIDSAVSYPVGFTSEELFWFNSHYADSLRYLQRDRVALTEYEKLLKWPGLTTAELCPLYLNRADAYVNIKDYEKALQDVMKAGTICEKNPSKEDAKKRLGYLSGGAGDAAITFSQKSRFQQGQPPIGEARKLQLEALKAKLGPKNARLLPKDQWLAVHVAGPEYRVFLRQETFNPASRKTDTQNLYIFLINLWNGKAKVEKSPAVPQAAPKGP
ncbi:MAG: zinc ribbon domain-containing protein [Elusimicrobiota bacterium]|nr:zinc ribbon domain-containing protein [Elusimicrobiota bacterium]